MGCKPGKEVCLGRLGVGLNYVCYLVIVVIFMRLEGEGRWWGVQSNHIGGMSQSR